MKINIQVENDNKDIVNSISSSLKDRTSMLRDFLVEMRKTHSMSMEKLMGIIKKFNKPQNNSMMLQAMRENGKINQSMMRTMKSMADNKESGHKEDMKSMMEYSNSLIKAMKDSMDRKMESKTVIVKTVNNNKSIENLTEAIRSGSFNRSRWIPSAS